MVRNEVNEEIYEMKLVYESKIKLGDVKMSWNKMTMKRPSSVIIRYRSINTREAQGNTD